jgi:hypothetical protein
VANGDLRIDFIIDFINERRSCTYFIRHQDTDCRVEPMVDTCPKQVKGRCAMLPKKVSDSYSVATCETYEVRFSSKAQGMGMAS